MRIGVARADITPDWSLPLAGFAARTGPSQGVAQPLHLRVLVLEHAGRRAVVVSADLLNWGPEQLPAWRADTARRCGADPDAVLFSATHSHSGPQPNEWALAATGVVDPRFLHLLGERLAAAADQAAAELVEVTAHRGRGEHRLAMHRRMMVDGQVVSRPNPAGPVDHEVTVVSFRGTDGRLVAALTHYACHPVISGEHQLSGEFTGDAMDRVEAATGAVSIYLQGCCGDINPGAAAHQGLAEIPRQGAALAEVVGAILADSPEPLAPVAPTARWDTAELPFTHAPTAAEIADAATQDGAIGQWGRAFAAHPERVAASATLHLQRLELARGLALLAMNGEVCVDYGLQIKQVSAGTVLPVAYSNGMIGYVPTAEQIDQGGYEADSSTLYYLLPGRFSRELDARVRARTVAMAAPA